MLERRRDRLNAAHAACLAARRLLMIGRLDEAEHLLSEIDPAPLTPPLRVNYELAMAGIAIRRLLTEAARVALGRAEYHAGMAGIPALGAEVANLSLLLTQAARLITKDGERLLRLDEVEALLASGAMVVDACRNVVRKGGTIVSLSTRSVLFALARSLAEHWPGDMTRACPARVPGTAGR